VIVLLREFKIARFSQLNVRSGQQRFRSKGMVPATDVAIKLVLMRQGRLDEDDCDAREAKLNER